jgi:hypothetical protein
MIDPHLGEALRFVHHSPPVDEYLDLWPSSVGVVRCDENKSAASIRR